MKQRGQITFEMEETIVLHEGSRAEKRFCRECKDIVLMVAPQAAAAVAGLTEREVFRFVESGKVHFTEDEPILVCFKSIGDRLNEITPSDSNVKVDLMEK